MNFNACESEVLYGYFEEVSAWNLALVEVISEKTSLPDKVTLELSLQETVPVPMQIQQTRPMQSTYGCRFPLDDKEARSRLWNIFFPHESLQEPEENAVEKYFGLFDKHVKEHRKGTFDEIMNES